MYLLLSWGSFSKQGMKQFYFSFLLLLMVVVGCSKKDSSKEIKQGFHVEITDSLQIDYLGKLWILDYDTLSKSYLAWGNENNEVLILDEYGSISSTFIFPSDGPEAIPGWINPIGLKDGEIQFFAGQDAFYGYDLEGKRTWKYKPESTYFYINGLKGDPLFSIGEELAFLRPEKGEMDWDGGIGGMFEKIYNSPILEVIDTTSNSSRLTMSFPEGSIYKDGNFHFWMFPTVSRYGTEWLLYFKNELKFWVYQEKGNEVVFQKELSLDVSDAISEKGVPFEEIDDYNELTAYDVPCSILEIYRTSEQVLVIYHKGISEEVAKQFDRSTADGVRELESLKKNYLAVFDSNFKLLQNDISVPQGLIFTTVLTENGEILALKHPDFFETEEDQVIYYKLEVVEK